MLLLVIVKLLIKSACAVAKMLIFMKKACFFLIAFATVLFKLLLFLFYGKKTLSTFAS